MVAEVSPSTASVHPPEDSPSDESAHPARLIDHGHVPHFQREGVAVVTDCQAAFGCGHDPEKSGVGDGRMKIMDLVCGGHGPPEQGVSYMPSMLMQQGNQSEASITERTPL